jgi:Ca-activated chloride channel family protein
LNKKPTFEVITERPVYSAGKEQVTDLLVRIIPPEPDALARRPQLNLGLVMDRSGSMEGEKIVRAREAICFCLDQLLAEDRVSIVIFDDIVEVLVPSQPVENKEQIKERIQQIRARNSTALHQAWVTGGIEVSKNLTEEAINRVILVTDGLANVGQTNPGAIVSQAGELAARGVSTSTIGIGSNFNEDLLIPMAEAGRGNAWHVEQATDMARIFGSEMRGLAAQLGHTVSLGLTPADGVTVQDVLNDFAVTHTGRYKLPNLLAGSPIEAVIRVKLPARAAGQRFKVMDMRLAWNPEGVDSSERELLNHSVSVDYTDAQEADCSPVDHRVAKAVQMLMAARARREAVELLDRGDITAARATVTGTLQAYAAVCASMPLDASVQEDLRMLGEIEEDLANRKDVNMTRKKMSYQSYQLAKQSRPLK